MVRRTLFALIGVLALASQTFAKAENPIIAVAQNIGERGLAIASGLAKSPTKYTPSDTHPGIDRWLKVLEVAEDQKATTRAQFLEVIEGVQAEAKKLGNENDAAYAYASATAVIYAFASQQVLGDEGLQGLTTSFRAAFDTPEIRAAKDADKQEAAEYALCTMQILLISAANVKTEEEQRKFKNTAGEMLTVLLGAKLDQFKMEGEKLTITGTAPKTGKLVEGFTFSKPTGWNEQSGWYVIRKTSPQPNSTDIKSAMVRFLPPVPATKNGGVILDDLWKTAIPQEIPRAGGMVFRRYVGDKNPTWFIYGKGLEKGKDADTLFTLMIVDCGKTWQPLVVAQTYEDPSMFKSGIQMSASFSYGETADMAEQMLSTFRFAPTAGKPLVDKEALSGNYNYGSSSSMDYVNVYTGASASSFVSYGGGLNLKSDGTFTYTFSSASSNLGSATNFGKSDGKGKYTIEGEFLVARFSEHNQWTSQGGVPSKLKDTVYTYRIGGLTSFSDGTKIAVLIQVPPNKPVNAVTVADSSNWYSTKKKD